MKISTQQYVNATVSIALVLVLGATLFVTSRQVSDAIEKNNFSGDVVFSISQLRYVMFEYILNHNERPKTQWRQRHESLGILLTSNIFEDTAEQAVMSGLRQRHQQLELAYNRLVERYETTRAAREDIAPPQGLEEQLVAELLEVTQEMLVAASRAARASDAELAQTQRQSSLLVLVFVMLLGVIVLANLYLTRNEILIPVAQLQRGMAIVGAGTLDYRTGSVSTNEIGEMSRAFDQMSTHLQESKAATDEMNASLIQSNEDLDGFSYSVSHDLRAPIRAIDGFTRMLAEDYSDKLDAEGQRLLAVVREETAKMDQLISDILAFSRAGRRDLALSEVDMEALARAVFDELAPAAGRAVNLRMAQLPRAFADTTMMRQVLVNLLSNAIKFTRTRDATTIEVSGHAEGDELVYCVEDNGVGFDPRYMHKLFGVFQRLHSAEEFEGTGIGLAIIKRIIDKHGGRVWAKSKLGEGAAFSFSLPRRTPGVTTGG